ncbi:MAG: ATP-binding cassette domain-containing protein [Planctomycetes bacterium]|nr:ATP-binding cassette domain-containing protein [Planctomycetota bacterium]
MTPPGFVLRSVSKVYDGRPALQDLSCALPEGEHLAIFGASGCGKTTLLRLLAGLEAPSSGEIAFNGAALSEANIVRVPPHERHLALVFQDLALWPNLSVEGNVLLGLAGKRCSRVEARMRAKEAMTLCGIAEFAKRKPGTLSGGQQQRAALARALAVQPAFLLLDEPFSGLDLVNKSQLLFDIAKLAANERFTIVLVCHDPFDAVALCKTALVLEQGRAVESGPLAELLQSPHSEILRVASRQLRGLEPKTPGS